MYTRVGRGLIKPEVEFRIAHWKLPKLSPNHGIERDSSSRPYSEHQLQCSNAPTDITEDQEALLQASRELTAALEQPHKVVSLVAFSESRADSRLESRILRVLVGLGFAVGARNPDGSHSFASTPVTKQMTGPSTKAGVKFLYVRAPATFLTRCDAY